MKQKKIGYVLLAVSLLLLLTLALMKAKVDEEEAFLCEIVHETPTLTMEECPAHNSNTSWLFLLSFVLAFAMGAAGFYFIFSPMPAAQEKTAQPIKDISKLEESEKKIYDLLRNNQGSLYQSDLLKETGYSKVALTRLLDKMENKQILERKRRGMTNLVVLK